MRYIAIVRVEIDTESDQELREQILHLEEYLDDMPDEERDPNDVERLESMKKELEELEKNPEALRDEAYEKIQAGLENLPNSLIDSIQTKEEIMNEIFKKKEA